MATKIQATDGRTWSDLPHDLLSPIFTQLGPLHIFQSLQLVCRSWRHHSQQPHLYRSLDLRTFKSPHADKTRSMVKAVLDRSRRQLVQLSAGPYSLMDVGILLYVIRNSNSIKRLRLHLHVKLNLETIVNVAGANPSLEELDLCCHLSAHTMALEKVGQRCPWLKLTLVQGQSGGQEGCPCAHSDPRKKRLRLVFSAPIRQKQSEKEQHDDEVTSSSYDASETESKIIDLQEGL